MQKHYHILNGDCLNKQFPKTISGTKIIARECLVDGNVLGGDLNTFFNTRATFIATHYKGYTKKDYYNKTVPEYKKMQSIPNDANIYLWFEDDLFCQVNLWFIIHLLNQPTKNYSLYLIHPSKGNEYCFGNMTKAELITAFQNKQWLSLEDTQHLSQLWPLYQNNDCKKMLHLANPLKNSFPFLTPAIKAQQDRLPKKGHPGRPTQSLKKIIHTLKTNEFKPIFKEFCKQEKIYGFGDIQVQRLLDQL